MQIFRITPQEQCARLQAELEEFNNRLNHYPKFDDPARLVKGTTDFMRESWGVGISHNIHDALATTFEPYPPRELRALASTLEQSADKWKSVGFERVTLAFVEAATIVRKHVEWSEQWGMAIARKGTVEELKLPPRPIDPIYASG